MGFTSKGLLPEDDNGKPVLGLMDDATGKVVPVHIGSKVTGADGKTYALLDVSATVTPAANQRVNAQSGDFVDGAIATIGAKVDTAITDSTTTNSQMSFIKGFVKILADAWDSGNHWLQVKAMNTNTSPVASQDIEQPNYTAATSPPTVTNAGSDTSYAFSSQVSRVIIQNNTSANVYYAFDVAASLGSLVLVPGGFLVYPKKVTILHLYTVAAANINGTAVGGIVVLGAN